MNEQDLKSKTKKELQELCKAKGMKGYSTMKKEGLIELLLIGNKEELRQNHEKQKESSFTFIDLFCGIGGFHQAMASLGGKCVLACEIDAKCRKVYKENYGLEPEPDVTKLDTAKIPDFDVLCGGFPCQAFSHAGKQGGFEDTRGTLFQDVARILKDKKPSFFLLENVKNLIGHDGGNTWTTIYNSLTEVGYTTYDMPIVMSPHHFGIPQHRERVIIMGVRSDLVGEQQLPVAPTYKPQPSSIEDILDKDDDAPKETYLSAQDIKLLDIWEKFVQHFKAKNIKLPTFPLWTDDWTSSYTTDGLPDWKAKFIKQNREFYEAHKEEFLEGWLTEAKNISNFKGAKAKFEWQCGSFESKDSLWNLLFQYRPSGIRVKRATYSPALVALAQIVYVGSKKRKLSPREVARLQSFPEDFKLPASHSEAYKQFGNAVNVEVIRQAALRMFELIPEA